MKTKIITSGVIMDKVQHSIAQATTMETAEGPIVVKPRHIDSSIITVTVVLVTGGEFDESNREALLAAINDKLLEIEI